MSETGMVARLRKALVGTGLLAALGCSAASGQAAEGTPYILDHEMKRIDGTPEGLATYKGKVVLIVNVASKCGMTPQYKGLEALYRDRKDDGLVILGFPANDFMGQEPGTNEDIAAFCETKYDVTFPMFEKISVKGDAAAPLYQQLSEATEPPSWNFTKYLVDREGKLVMRFGPRTKPDAPELVAEIDTLLAAGAPPTNRETASPGPENGAGS